MSKGVLSAVKVWNISNYVQIVYVQLRNCFKGKP